MGKEYSMEDVKILLMQCIQQGLLQAVISNPIDKQKPGRIKILPFQNKEEIFYQVSLYEQKKVHHRNYREHELVQVIIGLLGDYRQLQSEMVLENITILVSKKGKITVIRKRKEAKEFVNSAPMEHNRKKNYILNEGESVPFLTALGVMTMEGRVRKEKYHKFRQINRYLEFVEDILECLPRESTLHILDFGCGKSYLTFALYHYLVYIKDYDVKITGLDLKEDVIEECSRLARLCGYDDLTFLAGDIASFEGRDKIDMVVSLHACDTATDYALEKAVKWGAKVIFAVPCCQHELNGQIYNETMKPVLKYGIIKERIAALLTDAYRAGLLEEQGYSTQILEFIDVEHTPKNLLIRAVKNNKPAFQDLRLKESMELFHADPLLSHLLSRN